MKKAVIYARYSAGGNQTNKSIEGQLKVCRDFATREGFHIVHEYIDEKISGKEAEKRQAFQRMIDDSVRTRWEYVIVYQLDRFSRNKYDNAIYKEKLSRNGVKVISAMENLNTDDASGILMETMLEGMAAYYSKELAQKIRRGLAVNASKFQYIGHHPGFGFKVVNKQIVADETNAVYVAHIYEKYINGETMQEIINYMNSLGLKTSRGMPFSRTSLATILRNKRYCGVYSYQGVDTPDVLPRIVPQALFDQVQQKLENNKGAGGRGKAVEDYILSGKLYCGDCLAPMVGYSGTSKSLKKYRYYKEQKNGCKNLTIPKSTIEDKVIEVIRDMLTEENQQTIAREISALCEQEQGNPHVKRLKKLIKENEKAKANLLQSLKVGKASVTAANYVFSEIDRIEKETATFEQQAAVEEDRHYGLGEADIMYFLSHLLKGSENLDDIETRKLLINVLVNSIYVWNDNKKATIIFNVSNQPPVKVDISLLDMLQCNDENAKCSNADLSSRAREALHLKVPQAILLLPFYGEQYFIYPFFANLNIVPSLILLPVCRIIASYTFDTNISISTHSTAKIPTAISASTVVISPETIADGKAKGEEIGR
jgi:DNA invertase Pin-like site-specific DNA recombinase